MCSFAAAAQVGCPGAGGEDGDGGVAPALVAEFNGSTFSCSAASGAYATVQPRDEIDANRRFVAVLPDAAPAIDGARFAIGVTSVAQIIQQATCAGATISGVGSDQASVLLADGQSCALEIVGRRYSVTYTGATLSRSGGVYRLTSGTLKGGPFGGAVAKPNLDVTDVTGAIDIPNQPGGTPTTEAGTDFGDVLAGSFAARTYRVVNNGTVALTLLDNPVRLDNATDFQIETNLAGGDVLEPGASRTFTLRFNPSAAGEKSAGVTVASNDPDDDTYRFPIRGNGVIAPEIEVEGPAGAIADGGGDAVGTLTAGTAVTRTYTIANIANAPLEVSQITAGGASNVEIGLVAPGALTVAPGASETFSVSFTPIDGGAFGFALTLVSNDADESPYEIAVSGSGAAPELAVTSSTGGPIGAGGGGDDQGDRQAGAPVDLTYTISNMGTEVLEVASIGIGGASNVAVNEPVPASASIAPGGSATFQVRYVPQSAGAFGFNVVLVSNDLDEGTYTIGVSGNGATPEIGIAGPGSAAIADGGSDAAGDAQAGQRATRTYTISNTGNAPLNVSSISASGLANVAVDQITPAVLTVAAGGAETFEVAFTPAAGGPFAFTLSVVSDDLDEASYEVVVEGNGLEPEIAVSGNGVAIETGDTSPSEQDGTEFGSISELGGAVVQSFTIRNEGSGVLTLSGSPPVRIAGANTSEFAVVTQPAQTVPAGGSTVFEVAFNPSGVGLRQAEVVIENDDADEGAFTFAVQGTGLSGDTIAPDVVVKAPSRVTGPFEATVTFSEAVNGFAPADVALTNGTAATAFVRQTGDTYVVEVTPTEHGKLTIAVPQGVAQDAAGNANRSSAKVVVNYVDEAFVRQRTGRVIANFMSRRADHITAEDPDITKRLAGGGGQGASGPVAFTGSGTGASNRFAFATSLSQIAQAEAQEKRARLAGLGAGPMGLGYGSLDGPAIVQSGFDIWVQGKWARADGNSAESTIGLLYVGADYRFSKDFVAGFMAQFDWADQSERLAGVPGTIRADGTGWMAGPYVVARLHDNLIFDARAAWGQSSNSVSPFGTYSDSFDGERWLAKAQFTGDFAFGDIKFAPHVAVIYFEEQQKAYTDSLDVRIPGQTVSLGRFTFGPKVATTYRSEDGSTLAPYLALKGIWDFDPARLVDLQTGIASGSDRLRGRLEGGLSVQLPSGLSLTAEGAYDGIGTSDLEAYGGSVTVTIPLQGPARLPPG